MKPYHETDRGKIYHGDNIAVMKTLASESVDFMVTDPNYGLGFMGKAWDKKVPSVETWKEALRLLKPGSFAFIMSSPRQDVLAQNIVNLNEAGFVVTFTPVYWTYASGFPKAVNIGKAMGKKGEEGKTLDGAYGGFQPKPAVEVIIVAMKPMTEKTYVEQAMKNGKGITWLRDGSIPFVNDKDRQGSEIGFEHPYMSETANEGWKRPCHEKYEAWNPNERGRFPANLLVSDDVLNDGRVFDRGGSVSGGVPNNKVYGEFNNERNVFQACGDAGSYSKYFDLDRWFEERLKRLPPEVRETFPFLIVAKPGKSEKNKGLERLSIDNDHPTVKPVKLKAYLLTIGGRPGETVLDLCMGSGTTPTACEMLGYKYIAIDNDKESCDIAVARVEDEGRQKKLFEG